MSNIPSLKSAVEKEIGKTNVYGSGVEGAMSALEMISSMPQNESDNIDKKNKKEVMIKRPIKTGVSSKLVGKTKMKTPIGKLTTGLPIMGEDGETSESTGSGSAGGFSAPLFSTTKKEMEEDCWKGYKQIGGKKKNGKMVPNCVKEGKEEYCDSCDRVKSKCVCGETKKVEATEATGSGSSGQYSTTAAWAKSTSKKDWMGKSKTQIPGGKFVQVKKKCKKFPYCNQGDIKALKIFENENVKKAIKNISERHNISENVIKTIIAYEYENTFPKK
jgi:hypothetical protein